MANWMEENIGKTIILFDNDDRRYEGKLERVFQDFFQIFENRQRVSKIFKYSAIKDFSIKEN